MPRIILLIFLLFTKEVSSQELYKINLADENNTTYPLSSIKNNKTSVFIFFDTDCPLCKNYTLTVNELAKKYKFNNVQFYLIFPDKQTSASLIKIFRDYYKLNVITLSDSKHELLKLLKAKVTPEVFVFNSEAALLYSGAIDNWMYETGKKRKVVTQFYLDDVLSEISKGKVPKKKRNKAYGCIIEY
ncbi:MAG: redoxin domain-containing protein [Bacteroidetes bacterium]|nr:redoxin domain-containing protein [Bacteroidota bacterium]